MLLPYDYKNVAALTGIIIMVDNERSSFERLLCMRFLIFFKFYFPIQSFKNIHYGISVIYTL